MSRSVSCAALSIPLGRMAEIADRHFRPHLQARISVLGCVSMALRWSLFWTFCWPGSTYRARSWSSLVVQRVSQARSRWSWPRLRSNMLPKRPPSSPSASPRRRRLLDLLRSRPRRRLPLLLLRRLLLRLRLLFEALGGGGSGAGSMLLSQSRLAMASRRSLQRPSSGKVCIMAGQLPRTQSLKRFASATAARFSKQRKCARKRFGAQS
mmetsp:Transcript_21052/g.44909  ORF Transcript_21052/g.44909 Transcript_21052/m.44909 type:complete len:209 (+) Transcript_21052:568-1194(+)